MSKAVVALRSLLAGIPYPFEAGDAGHDLATHAIPHPPKAGDYAAIHGSAEQALNATAEVEHRLLAELAATGTAVESALGLEPLPERE